VHDLRIAVAFFFIVGKNPALDSLKAAKLQSA